MLRGILTIGGWTSASRLLGLLRETLIAAFIGVGPLADAFVMANRIPNMFRRLFGEGAFNAAFVPMFAELRAKEGQEVAERFAAGRIFPDEVVCCGPRSVFVPYMDPGLKLAQTIREQTLKFIDEQAAPPRVILLKSHGIITLGSSPEAVKAAMYMAVKAASIFAGAAALGGPVFMSEAEIERIGSRRDEHYRQQALKL